MMTFETDPDSGVMEFTVDGGVTRADYDAAARMMDAAIAQHGKLSAVAVIRSFSGMDPGAWWKDLSWGIAHLNKIGRVAVVTEIEWMKTAIRMTAPVYPGEIKLFEPDSLDAARIWARG